MNDLSEQGPYRIVVTPNSVGTVEVRIFRVTPTDVQHLTFHGDEGRWTEVPEGVHCSPSFVAPWEILQGIAEIVTRQEHDTLPAQDDSARLDILLSALVDGRLRYMDPPSPQPLPAESTK